jgi:hypothetical protein
MNTLLFVDIAWRILVPLRRSPPAPTRGRSAACKAVFDPDLEPGSNANVVVRREPATGEGDPAMEFEDAGRCLSRMLEDLHVCF